MSTRRHCEIFKADDGRWYVELGSYEDHWDEYDDPFEVYGPFPSEASAERELRNHSNPGGYDVDDSGRRRKPSRPRRSAPRLW